MRDHEARWKKKTGAGSSSTEEQPDLISREADRSGIRESMGQTRRSRREHEARLEKKTGAGSSSMDSGMQMFEQGPRQVPMESTGVRVRSSIKAPNEKEKKESTGVRVGVRSSIKTLNEKEKESTGVRVGVGSWMKTPKVKEKKKKPFLDRILTMEMNHLVCSPSRTVVEYQKPTTYRTPSQVMPMKPEPEPEPEQQQQDQRNWADLPTKALTIIFLKLGAPEVLRSAQAVCHSWWLLSLNSAAPFWRCFDMRSLPNHHLFSFHHDKLAEAAFDRADDRIHKLCAMSVSDEFLTRVTGRTATLTCFSLTWGSHVSPAALLRFLGDCPMLDELRLYGCRFPAETYGEIGRTCPRLRRLWVEGEYDSEDDVDDEAEYLRHKKILKWGGSWGSDSDSSDPGSDYDHPDIRPGELSYYDSVAMQIAGTMPHLLHLQLIRNLTLTNQGLCAILSSCLHLESLDLRCCFHVRVDEDLQAKLDNINSIKLSRPSRLLRLV